LGVELFLLLVGQLQVLGGEAVFAVGQQVVEADLLAAVVGGADVGGVGRGGAAAAVCCTVFFVSCMAFVKQKQKEARHG